jgi:hypothetical protein
MSKLITLGEQLHIGICQALIPMVVPVRNRAFVKPEGGLWTSTLLPKSGSDWVEWCAIEDFDAPYEKIWHVLKPLPARILVIDSLADLEAVLPKYSVKLALSLRYPDFEKLATAWDAIHLTSRGQVETRLSYPDNLYGWDSESTLWFRWCFDEVRRVEPFGRPGGDAAASNL